MSRFNPGQPVSALNHKPGVRETNTLTFPTTAGATQSDYVTLTNAAGTIWAIWLDIDANGTAPTGALYVAADVKIEVDIVGGGTAAQNGTLAMAAIDGVIVDVSFVDNLDGTISVTMDDVGNADDAVPKNADDSGAGSISVSASDGSSESNPYPSAGDTVSGLTNSPSTVT